MNTYAVELPNGKIVTRNSKKDYTHAVVIRVVDGGEFRYFDVLSFASSEDLAEKAGRAYASRTSKNCYKGSTYEVVSVKAVA